MKIIISGIPDEGIEQEADVPVTISDGAKPDIAHVVIKIVKYAERLQIEGSVSVSVTMKCGRCLKDYILPLDLDFREEYVPVAEVVKDGERELKPDELDISFYSGDELDIGELVKEEILLAVPMKPLCGETCRGLCTICGKDLNEEACECRKEEVDPRLAPLAKYKEFLKERKE